MGIIATSILGSVKIKLLICFSFIKQSVTEQKEILCRLADQASDVRHLGFLNRPITYNEPPRSKAQLIFTCDVLDFAPFCTFCCFIYSTSPPSSSTGFLGSATFLIRWTWERHFALTYSTFLHGGVCIPFFLRHYFAASATMVMIIWIRSTLPTKSCGRL
jgi:hypothetical protein